MDTDSPTIMPFLRERLAAQPRADSRDAAPPARPESPCLDPSFSSVVSVHRPRRSPRESRSGGSKDPSPSRGPAPVQGGGTAPNSTVFLFEDSRSTTSRASSPFVHMAGESSRSERVTNPSVTGRTPHAERSTRSKPSSDISKRILSERLGQVERGVEVISATIQNGAVRLDSLKEVVAKNRSEALQMLSTERDARTLADKQCRDLVADVTNETQKYACANDDRVGGLATELNRASSHFSKELEEERGKRRGVADHLKILKQDVHSLSEELNRFTDSSDRVWAGWKADMDSEISLLRSGFETRPTWALEDQRHQFELATSLNNLSQEMEAFRTTPVIMSVSSRPPSRSSTPRGDRTSSLEVTLLQEQVGKLTHDLTQLSGHVSTVEGTMTQIAGAEAEGRSRLALKVSNLETAHVATRQDFRDAESRLSDKLAQEVETLHAENKALRATVAHQADCVRSLTVRIEEMWNCFKTISQTSHTASSHLSSTASEGDFCPHGGSSHDVYMLSGEDGVVEHQAEHLVSPATSGPARTTSSHSRSGSSTEVSNLEVSPLSPTPVPGRSGGDTPSARGGPLVLSGRAPSTVLRESECQPLPSKGVTRSPEGTDSEPPRASQRFTVPHHVFPREATRGVPSSWVDPRGSDPLPPSRSGSLTSRGEERGRERSETRARFREEYLPLSSGSPPHRRDRSPDHRSSHSSHRSRRDHRHHSRDSEESDGGRRRSKGHRAFLSSVPRGSSRRKHSSSSSSSVSTAERGDTHRRRSRSSSRYISRSPSPFQEEDSSRRGRSTSSRSTPGRRERIETSQIPNWDGVSDAGQWLHRIQTAVAQAGRPADDGSSIAAMRTVPGTEPAIWFDNLRKGGNDPCNMTWSRLKREVMCRFGGAARPDALKASWLAVKCRSAVAGVPTPQEVSSYYDRFFSALCSYEEQSECRLSNEEITRAYLAGLPSTVWKRTLHSKVERTGGWGKISLDSLAKAAYNEAAIDARVPLSELRLSESKHGTVAAVASSSYGSNDRAASPPRRPATCFACGLEGHVNRACPVSPPPTCTTCGKQGHLARFHESFARVMELQANKGAAKSGTPSTAIPSANRSSPSNSSGKQHASSSSSTPSTSPSGTGVSPTTK